MLYVALTSRKMKAGSLGLLKTRSQNQPDVTHFYPMLLTKTNLMAQPGMVGVYLSLDGSRNCWRLSLVATAGIRRTGECVLRENKSEKRWMKGTGKTIHKTWLCMGSAALITEKEEIRVEERKWGSCVF